jgi:hypothetical protein
VTGVLFGFMTARRQSAGHFPAMTRGHGPGRPTDRAAARCSFCGKGRHRVDGLAMAAGTTTTESIRTRTEFGYAAASGPQLPWVSICSDCVARCYEIVRDT